MSRRRKRVIKIKPPKVKERKRLTPPSVPHKKKKGRGSYDRKKLHPGIASDEITFEQIKRLP
jgi:hypothetical protein